DGGVLRDLTVIYRARLNERIPQPAQLAHLLEEATPADRVLAGLHGGLDYRAYDLDGVVAEAAVIPHNFAAGGVVRFHDGRHAGPGGGGRAARRPPGPDLGGRADALDAPPAQPGRKRPRPGSRRPDAAGAVAGARGPGPRARADRAEQAPRGGPAAAAPGPH